MVDKIDEAKALQAEMKPHSVRQTDVHSIKNPAYVVNSKGCIVEWNKEFVELTNLTPNPNYSSTCKNDLRR